MSDCGNKLSPVSVWALAAGGMVGGGIYTVLGVVIAVSAKWAWLAFAFTGVMALTPHICPVAPSSDRTSRSN